MVLVVVRNDQVFFRGYGETAPNSHQVPSRDSLLRLCSLTKIFTTDVLTKLVADKTVRLDDPLQRYAPKGTVVPKRNGPITLADLATHTSGLPRELGNAPAGTPHFTFPDYRTRWRWLPNQRLRSTPGATALYSNVAFDLPRRCPPIRGTQAIRHTSCGTHSRPAPYAAHDLLSQRRAMQSSADRRPRGRTLHRHRSHCRQLRPLFHRSRYGDLAQVPASDRWPGYRRTGHLRSGYLPSSFEL